MKKEESILEKLNKKAPGLLLRASSSAALHIPRLPIGIFSLDAATGGGIPLGRVTGIFGKKSSGKTVVALKIVASAQKFCRKHWRRMIPTDKRLLRCLACGFLDNAEGDCPDCHAAGFSSKLVDRGDFLYICPECKKYNPMRTVWMDLEGAWSNEWAQKQGVNCHYVFLSRPEYAEQAIDVSDAVLRDGDFDFLVIDTLAHMVPMAEIEESVEKWQQGLQARLINKMLRKLISAINHPGLEKLQRPTILMLNQIRFKIGVFYGDPEVKPGGEGQNFATSMDIKLWSGKYEKDEAGNTLSMVTNFRVVKNKCSAPMHEGNFRLWLTENNNRKIGDTEETEVVIGIAFEKGLFGNSREGWNIFGESAKTKEEIVQRLISDSALFEKTRNSLLSMRLGTVLSDESAMKVKTEGDEEDESPEE